MNLKFSERKSINIDNVKKIFVKTTDGKPVRIITGKCDSFGIKKDERYDSKSMSIILDENSIKNFKDVIGKCEEHLKKPLSKILYEREDGSCTVYAKIRDRSVFYDEQGKEIDPIIYERKSCEVKAVLEIEGIILSEAKASLQVKIYEAMVRKRVYKHVRILDMEW